jgi:hypothetical protein
MLSGLVEAVLKNFAEETIAGIKSRIPNVTGQSADSLGYRIVGTELTIFSSLKFFTVLETGRKPGKRPPISVIEQWIKDKPIIPDGISTRSLAFLIARKIGEEGSLLYRNGGKSGVISKSINDQVIKEKLTDVLTDKFRDYVINEFVRKSLD